MARCIAKFNVKKLPDTCNGTECNVCRSPTWDELMQSTDSPTVTSGVLRMVGTEEILKLRNRVEELEEALFTGLCSAHKEPDTRCHICSRVIAERMRADRAEAELWMLEAR